MRHPLGFFVLILTLFSLSCRESNGKFSVPPETNTNTLSCFNLPDHFLSYAEGKAAVISATFKINETVNTIRSSWIRGASFYSCDGIRGYFLLQTDDKEYLFQGMPFEIWEGFKNASSFGQYYHTHIRDRFYLYVGQ